MLTICIDSANRYLYEFAYPFDVAEAIGVTACFAHVTFAFADCTDINFHHIDAFAVLHLDEQYFVADDDAAAAANIFKFRSREFGIT